MDVLVLAVVIGRSSFQTGDNKEMSSVLADQLRPRTSIVYEPKCVGRVAVPQLMSIAVHKEPKYTLEF